MGLASYSRSPILSALLAPVQVLAAWFVPSQRISSKFSVPAGAQQFPQQLGLPVSSGSATKSGKISSKKPAFHRLKVVREFDSGASPACAGRMVISGRMADVCEELERMAHRETAAH